MRSARLLSLVGLVLLPSLASAQEKNPFADSWFWGAKGGVAVLHTLDATTAGTARTNAPTFGAEWLITRSRFGLYMSLDQAYFSATSTVNNAPGNVQRLVDIRDMRRMSAAVYMFPHVWLESIRPYFGLGYAFNFVVHTSTGDQFANPSSRDTVLSRIQNAKSRSSITGTAGLQLDWKRFAPFIQATAMPTKGSGSFLINGDGFSYYVEAGLRYNFGSAIEKLK